MSLKTVFNTAVIKLLTLGGILFVVASLTACAPQNTDSQSYDAQDPKLSAHVVYGADGRLDLYQTTDGRMRELADSTVAFFQNSSLLPAANGLITVNGKNYGTSYNLCSSEKFREQNSAAFCSGSLVGPDLIMTAGHCVETLSACQNTSVAFGFAVQAMGAIPQQLKSSEVYKCKEIVKTVRINTGADYALIRLDRPASNHKVLKIRRTGEANIGDELFVIGHPMGLPTKITTGGRVRSIANPDFMVTNLDTYGGNSGSAVFNAITGLIEGILVRGETDLMPAGSCYKSYACSEDSCRGEDVTRISLLRALIPETADSNPGSGSPTDPNPAEPVPPAVPAPELFSVSPRQSIPDNSAIGITSQLLVASAPQGRKVIVSIDLTHTYIGDLVIQVVAPNGKVVLLHSRAGGRTANIKKSYDVTAGLGAVPTGGTYKLIVKDLGRLDVGVLKSWSVEFK